MIIPENLLAECHSYGVDSYPEECCGFIIGLADGSDELETVIPMKNIMNQLHEDDPEQFPRTARDGYVIEPREHMKLERKLKKENREIKIIFHSHPDCGAYFSEKDKEDALWNGNARYPGIGFLVCATDQGIPGNAILADFNESSKDFDITQIEKLTPRKNTSLVGGKFGITGILPNLDFIHQWKNGEKELEFGYFRFVSPPQVKQIQSLFTDFYGVRHALAYNSGKSALFELLTYIKESIAQPTLHVAEVDNKIYPEIISLEINCQKKELSELSSTETLSGKQGDLLLISVGNGSSFIQENRELLKKLKKQRVPVILYSPLSGKISEWPIGLNYWVSGFSADISDQEKKIIDGGIIFGNTDRQMAEMTELRKRRGLVLSSRNASIFCNQFDSDSDSAPLISGNDSNRPTLFKSRIEKQVTSKLAKWEKAVDGFLFPTGMAAISTLMALLRNKQKSKVIVIGLLYSETYALLMDAGKTSHWEAIFLDTDELDRLPGLLSDDVSMIITETITNPLGAVPDLHEIGKIAREHKIRFVVDNTLASPMNCQPIVWGVDFVIHSTTKYLSGCNHHGGGAIFVHDMNVAEQLKKLQQKWEIHCSPLEIEVLDDCLNDFDERMARFNQNGKKISQFLEEHERVDRVYHASLPSHPSHQIAKKMLSDVGGVISFTLKNSGEENLGLFYDGEFDSILKAPTLGSNQTLICPYALLTHYHDSDEALEEIELPRYLIRISAGSEQDISPVLKDLKRALARINP